MDPVELEAWLRLQCTAGVGSRTARVLLSQIGLPDSIFRCPIALLMELVGPVVARALHSEPAHLQTLLQTSLRWLADDSTTRRCLTLGDADYPQTLLNLEDPPLMLWAIGPASLWSQGGLNALAPRSVAVVGSRNPTPQGAENARLFSAELARHGVCVVSGLAQGIDGAAHEGALEGAAETGACTIAVVGTGLDRVYPKQHLELAHRITERGFIVSEYVLGTPPLAANFPRRNRILCGLARGTLVVEAALKSGSLITAHQTIEQGKDVFAIPGSIHSTQSRGCHKLIKEGAKLVEDAQDILDELAWNADSPAPKFSASLESSAASKSSTDWDPNRTPEAKALLDAMGYDPNSLDSLQARTGLDTSNLQVQLMNLELSNQVRRLPGGLFQRVIPA